MSTSATVRIGRDRLQSPNCELTALRILSETRQFCLQKSAETVTVRTVSRTARARQNDRHMPWTFTMPGTAANSTGWLRSRSAAAFVWQFEQRWSGDGPVNVHEK
ncbi:hypothetical protein ACIHCQ_29710 [Streptomyces sp. NPDC052236]|uniref:hypothetical protein n=1 Tax=Streptomyces sp. NPDC052236 TaxID=3365686 RepID=UPI0037D4009E